MGNFIVEGGIPLKGSIEPAGNKNEALPVLAAALLASDHVYLKNIPKIGDVECMVQIMEACGATAQWTSGHEITIHTNELRHADLPDDVCAKIRASVLFLAPFLIRCGRVRLPFPGGDRIGRRRIDTHLLGFEALGAKLKASETHVEIWREGRLKGADILLDEASVTATENIVMAAAAGRGHHRHQQCRLRTARAAVVPFPQHAGGTRSGASAPMSSPLKGWKNYRAARTPSRRIIWKWAVSSGFPW
jgi:UDP-N-acetylglucosamine 1-carboxyvinyltransferase